MAIVIRKILYCFEVKKDFQMVMNMQQESL